MRLYARKALTAKGNCYLRLRKHIRITYKISLPGIIYKTNRFSLQ